MKNKSLGAELAMLFGMVIAVFSAGFCGFAADYHDITDTVFRLHIIANSDSEADQLLKLKVRDEILNEFSYIFENCTTSEDAANAAETHLNSITETAQRVIFENGSDYTVKCEITDMYFDNRVYGSVTMPAGEYSALRITIGKAEGKNWWCVMFPPLCLPAVSCADDVLADGGFTQEEIEMLNNPQNYECRLYIIELVEKLRNYIGL